MRRKCRGSAERRNHGTSLRDELLSIRNGFRIVITHPPHERLDLEEVDRI
jgi:hypothetical protein